MKRSARVVVAAMLLVGVLAATVVTPAPSALAQDQQCFAETGFCVAGRFLAHWQTNGGLALNGYPLSDERVETLEDGNRYLVQYFERVRLELHPENSPPNDVLLGQFGRRILEDLILRDPARYQRYIVAVEAVPDQAYFPETGHNLGGGFLAYWGANGGVPQFGFPLTEEFVETLEDGRDYRVQYFERARFEFHPENSAPNDILLGQFGRRILAGGLPVAVAPPVPGTPTPGIPPTLTAPLSRDAFRAYVREKYGRIGGRQITITGVSISTNVSSGNTPFASLSIQTSDTEAIAIKDQVSKADLQAYGEALLRDLKVQFPGYHVLGNLGWGTYSTQVYSNSDCIHQSDRYNSSRRGFFTFFSTVAVSYVANSDRVTVCGGQ